MGVLVDPPAVHRLGTPINWESSVIGAFYGPNPPPLHVIQMLVDSRWTKRGPIVVKKIGHFFAFLCSNQGDVSALLEQNTTVMDGRIIVFRRGYDELILRKLNFRMAKIWVRI